ncbi:MAG: hypothetical protein IPM18_06110 [Phycisphaerales bacterium]|nr:hypothetical protein [Phycisphaerales bacterium]
MTARLLIYRDGALDGPTNMARDEHLLYAEHARPAALRIYGWNPPTLSLGYFQPHAALAELPPEVRALTTVRRLTGGGAILHDCEITYCLALDATQPLARQAPIALYTHVHACWRAALGADGIKTELAPESFPLPTPRTGPFFCFAKPGRTDLLVGSDKLLGSAQRRVTGRVLQHGSLLLTQRFAAHPGADLGTPAPEQVNRWTERFISELATILGLPTAAATWRPEDLADIALRRVRYTDPAWVTRR